MPARSGRPYLAVPGAARSLATSLGTGLALAAMFALAGCGGGSSTPSKAQYTTKVNAICATEHAEMTQVARSKTKLPAKVNEGNTIREHADAQIEAIKSPKGGEAISPEWMRLRARALALAKRISVLGFGTPATRIPDLEYVTVSNNAERLALAYGLSSCRGFAAV